MYRLMNICCLCLKPGNSLFSIHDADSDNPTYYEKLSLLFSEMVSDSEPMQLCQECAININAAVNFHNKCISSLKTYRNLRSSLCRSSNKKGEVCVQLNNLLKNTCVETENENYNDGILTNSVLSKVECVYETSDIHVPNVTQEIPLKHEISTLEDCGLEDNIESHKNRRSDDGNHNDERLENSEINIVHNKDINKLDFTSHLKVEEVFIKDEYISDKDEQEHTSFEGIEDHFENEASSHPADEPHKCSVCGETFTQADLLKEHMQIHKGNKRSVCLECGKSFSTTSNLKVHMVLHTKEKPYKCGDCGKAFSQPSTLNKHVRVHTGEKPYECKECGKAFSEQGTLNRHLRLHTGERPYKCKECGKAFSQMYVLNIHMRLHTGEKPYTCKECGKAFRQTHHLNTHMNIHTNEKL